MALHSNVSSCHFPPQRRLQFSSGLTVLQRHAESRDGHLAIKMFHVHKCMCVCSMTTGMGWRRWQGESLAKKQEEDPALLMPMKLYHETPWSSISWHSSLCEAYGDPPERSVIKRPFCLNLWPPRSVQQGQAEEQPWLRRQGCSWFLGWF